MIQIQSVGYLYELLFYCCCFRFSVSLRLQQPHSRDSASFSCRRRLLQQQPITRFHLYPEQSVIQSCADRRAEERQVETELICQSAFSLLSSYFRSSFPLLVSFSSTLFLFSPAAPDVRYVTGVTWSFLELRGQSSPLYGPWGLSTARWEKRMHQIIQTS